MVVDALTCSMERWEMAEGGGMMLLVIMVAMPVWVVWQRALVVEPAVRGQLPHALHVEDMLLRQVRERPLGWR